MSGGSQSLALKEEDVTKFLASNTHIGATNLDFQMEQYVFKRRPDALGGEPSVKLKKGTEYRRSTAAQFLEEEEGQSSSPSKNSDKSKKQSGVECRRSTAAQFFVEEETVQQAATSDRVAELLNDAVINNDAALENLKIVQELILHKEPQLLDNFLDEVVAFQSVNNTDIRKFVVGFIEEVCTKEPQVLPKVVGNLNMLLSNEGVAIKKRVIQAMCQLYKAALKWFSSAKTVDEIMEATWASIVDLKIHILKCLDSENDGLRTQTLKFMESIVLCQTFKDEYSNLREGDISLDDIPVILKIFRPRKMEEEAKEIFEAMVAFHSASHISSYNLTACMQSLTNIAKKRVEFFPKVLQAFESLHANLPPTLGQSQVTSVRKTLKAQLLVIAKHSVADEFQYQISPMLSDLGISPQQISKLFPNLDSSKKRQKPEDVESASKKVKTGDAPKGNSVKLKKLADKLAKAKNTAIDITAEDLVPRLVPVNVTDLVLVTMLNLPDAMPAQFRSSYTPIAAAGTEPQIKHLARLLSTQFTVAGMGKGVEVTKAAAAEKAEESEEEEEDDDPSMKRIKILVGGMTEQQKTKKKTVVLLPTGMKGARYQKQLNLLDITKPMSKDESNRMAQSIYEKILNADKCAANQGVSATRSKILSTLAMQLKGSVGKTLKNYILENPRGRMDLAFSWLYEEYASYQGFNGAVDGNIEDYEDAMTALLSGVLKNEEHKCSLLGRFYMELPHVPLNTLGFLKTYCVDETSAKQVLHIAKTMTLKRPPRKLDFLGVISELTLHEKIDVRAQAVKVAVELHSEDKLKAFIEAFALRSLKFLLKPVPPPEFVVLTAQPVRWSDDLTKVCLHLYLSLLPVNHHLIHDLSSVYVDAPADIKRIILRNLEAPVKGMSMRSPELLLLVEKCPKGAETLVTRIIHIMTDKAPPSVELVSRVRDLYHKRVPDVRFLIPIINGLTKKEIIAALPELIKLNPTVVKEVFNRLLGNNFASPLTPAELLVALHTIDPARCNLKVIIKATSLCFEEKNVYTQVVLAVVIQQLMELNPLPILLMRTVIQSLANYPHLLGFVTNILKRLIEKQVWKQKKIWEGFIKCCQRSKPQSLQVLLQLPATQLEEVLTVCPDLRHPFCQHVNAFTEHQKAHIPDDVMAVVAMFQPPPSEVEPPVDDLEPIDESKDMPVD